MQKIISEYIHTLDVCQKRIDALHVTLQFFNKIGAEHIAICIADDAIKNQLVIRLSFGMQEASNKIILPSRPGKCGVIEAYKQNRVIRKDEGFIISDIEEHLGLNEMSYFPLYKEEKHLGAIMATIKSEKIDIASQLAVALSTYLLKHPVLQSNIDAQLEEGNNKISFEEINTAFDEMNNAADIFELSDITMKHCLNLTRSEFGFVGYIDPKNGFLTCPTLTKEIFPESKIEGKTLVFEKPGGLGGLVIDTNRPLVANDPMNHPASVGTPPGHLPIRKFMGVPCMIGSQKVGMIALANKLVDYTKADLNVIKNFGALYAAKVSMFFERDALIESRDKLYELYNESASAYYRFHPDGEITELNATAKDFFGKVESIEDIFDENNIIHIKNQMDNQNFLQTIELETTIDGTLHYFIHSMKPYYDKRGYIRYYNCALIDITEQKQSQLRIDYLAYHDEITGLVNRNMMTQHLEQLIYHAKRKPKSLVLYMFDIDRFKNINDSLGHSVGDELLKAVASRLKDQFRHSDLICRFGGDEFVILVDTIKNQNESKIIADNLLECFKQPFSLDNRTFYISVTVGISLYPVDAQNVNDMIKHADTAMYNGKVRGGNCYTFFESTFNEQVRYTQQIEADMHKSLQSKDFYLQYQPQYEVKTGSMIGFEALVRWRHPQKGVIPPDQFIPTAEECGFIVDLGKWIIEEGIRQTAQWNKIYEPSFKVSINISAKQMLHSEGVINTIESCLKKYSVDPKQIWLEITETSLVNIELIKKCMLRLRELNLSFAIDDFGTGYSSLGYLQQLPIEVLKIDRTFIRDIGSNKDDEALARTIISVAYSLGMKVIAEGVETIEQLDFLKQNKCHYYQGYYGSKPLDVLDAQKMLKKRS
jgi:diguanylate cyclase (GGDEF)-like protein